MEDVAPSRNATAGLEGDDRMQALEQQSTGNNPNQAHPSTVQSARKLVKTVLDQGSMSPFPQSLRPVLWDYASALQLYPLPTAFILADSEIAPFCVTYEGCHAMNPGKFIPDGDLSTMTWIEYDLLKNRGRVRGERF
jgi:DNA polymerase epsilon subunit 2